MNRYAKPLSQESRSLEVFYADSFSKGEDPEARLTSNERIRIELFDESIYLSTAYETRGWSPTAYSIFQVQ